MSESLDSWFKREILVHEGALVRYLLRLWPSRDEVDDLRQEIYIRVYEAAAKARPHSPKSFLFATARHLMTDRIRRARIVAIDAVEDLESLNVLVDEVSPEARASAHQELRRLAEAIDVLPDTYREVVWLRRVEDIPQKEVAIRLGITEKSVEKYVMRGMRLLADWLRSADSAGRSEPGSVRREICVQDITDPEHGES